MSWGWVGCAAYESGVGMVIIRIKAISVQLNLPPGTELGNMTTYSTKGVIKMLKQEKRYYGVKIRK